MPNQLLRPDMAPYATPDNALARQPTWADAAQWHGQNLSDTWTALQNPQTWLDAVRQYGNALLMGSIAPGIRAYHGSPYDFERFDPSKIGTGTRAQAYGYGLYFAEHPEVAETYRDASPASRGHAYEVNINADPEHFLQWDKPLSEQTQYVQDALKKAGYPIPPRQGARDVGDGFVVDYTTKSGEPKTTPVFPHSERGEAWAGPYALNPTGEQIYQYRVSSEPDQVAVAQALRDAGIPGVRYPASLESGSAAVGEDTHNYVVFDPSTIDILRKYGIAGLIAGGTAAGASQSQGQ